MHAGTHNHKNPPQTSKAFFFLGFLSRCWVWFLFVYFRPSKTSSSKLSRSAKGFEFVITICANDVDVVAFVIIVSNVFIVIVAVVLVASVIIFVIIVMDIVVFVIVLIVVLSASSSMSSSSSTLSSLPSSLSPSSSTLSSLSLPSSCHRLFHHRHRHCRHSPRPYRRHLTIVNVVVVILIVVIVFPSVSPSYSSLHSSFLLIWFLALCTPTHTHKPFLCPFILLTTTLHILAPF